MRHLFVTSLLLASYADSPTLLARVKELNVILNWNPNERPSVPVLDMTGGVYGISVAAVVDRRDKGKQIGENTEEKVPVPVYTTSDVPVYVREHLAAQLKTIGLDVKAADTGD